MKYSKKEVNELVDSLVKILPLVSGAIYVLGIIVISLRLAIVGVSSVKLFDMNYFIAGIPLALVLFLTWITYEYSKRLKIQKKYRITFAWFNVLIFFLPLFLLVFQRRWLFSFLVTFEGVIITIFFLLITIFTSSSTTSILYNSKSKGGKMFRVFDMLYIIYVTTIFIVLTVVIYSLLPQAFGGGKPEEVLFYVNVENFPEELINGEWDGEGSIAETIKLSLIHRTEEEFLVYPNKGGISNGVYAISADAVYVILYGK